MADARPSDLSLTAAGRAPSACLHLMDARDSQGQRASLRASAVARGDALTSDPSLTAVCSAPSGCRCSKGLPHPGPPRYPRSSSRTHAQVPLLFSRADGVGPITHGPTLCPWMMCRRHGAGDAQQALRTPLFFLWFDAPSVPWLESGPGKLRAPPNLDPTESRLDQRLGTSFWSRIPSRSENPTFSQAIPTPRPTGWMIVSFRILTMSSGTCLRLLKATRAREGVQLCSPRHWIHRRQLSGHEPSEGSYERPQGQVLPCALRPRSVLVGEGLSLLHKPIQSRQDPRPG